MAFVTDAADRSVRSSPVVSFLQTPAWARVKPEWRGESVGFFRDGTLVGAGLVLYRGLPRIPRSLAYLPEGPVLDWAAPDVADALQALAAHVKRRGAFGLRIGPTLVWRRWDADAVKSAVADDNVVSLAQATPTSTDRAGTRLVNALRHLGWRAPKEGEGFAAGQPQYNFALPLVTDDGTAKSDEALLSGMNQLWRRNIKKADKLGVEVLAGSRDDLARFHELYLVTAARDHFTPRPLGYFETMWDALNGEDPDRMRVYLATHEGDLVAATTFVRVGRHAWYSYGASSNDKREVRGSNAIQWRMIRDARDAGAIVYDLRGITPGVGLDDPEIGLIQFKVGTGGEAYSYVGEWDLPINRALYAAFDLYMNRRRR
ncbi:MAG TPA: peptidoglycan bridge formation glycyltransferase FemA/FemB family protein [Propionibacteriaceae bacterium]|nr:peptidoglycan bridge formation glycyltransferase FemA/FemB family protein [Propionibacteriaceae bacterium]